MHQKANTTIDMSAVSDSGTGGQCKEITFEPKAIPGLLDNEPNPPNSEAKENSTGCPKMRHWH